VNNVLVKEDAASSDLVSDHGQGVDRMLDELDHVHPDAGKPPEVAVALAELLRKLIRPKDAHSTALRFVALAHHLAPDVIAQTLTASAKQMGITRAGLSKTGMNILAEYRIPSRYHKSTTARENYRRAQIRSFRLGRHASQVKGKKKPKSRSGG